MSTIYENQQVSIEEAVGCKCDICGAEDRSVTYDSGWDQWAHIEVLPAIDSYHMYDVCSVKCYKALINKLADDEQFNRLSLSGVPVKYLEEIVNGSK